MVESGQVPGNGRIGTISKNCPGSTRNGLNLFEYRKMVESRRVTEKVELERVSKNCPSEYWERVESV